MIVLVTCQWFDHGQATKSVDFYAAIFPDSHADRSNAPASVGPDA